MQRKVNNVRFTFDELWNGVEPTYVDQLKIRFGNVKENEDSDTICKCGKPYNFHPFIKGHITINRLCDGTLITLKNGTPNPSTNNRAED